MARERIHRLTVAQAIESLHTAKEGLTEREAIRRLAEYGPNQVEESTRIHLWLQVMRQFTHVFAHILLVAALLAFFAEARAPGQGMGALG